MELLPKSRSEFTSKQYWEKFFQKRAKTFEWYGEYNDLCGILHKYIKQPDKVLIVGCGNSRLSADLFDVGYKNTTSIDISDTVIAQMKGQHAKERPQLSFVKMDVTKLEYEDSSFSVVLDKGTLDALMPDTDAKTMTTVLQMLDEIARVLRVGGRYMCVTLAQPHLLQRTLDYFSDLGWMIRVCRVPEIQKEDSDFHLPVFVIVFTKFKKMPGMKLITEISNFEETVERLEDVEALLAVVHEVQQYGMIRQQISSKSHSSNDITLDLFSSNCNAPRYTIHIVDQPLQKKNKFAIFIVPEGRETEWMFGTMDGRVVLSESAGYQRLLVVVLSRDHSYDDGLDGVKAELSAKVMELAPKGVNSSDVPFLSIGNDINTRMIRYRGNSAISGEFVVEDVDSGESSVRRLVFLRNPSVVRSEMRLVSSGKKRTPRKMPDPHVLSFAYHKHMVGGFAFLENFKGIMESTVNALLIGLGSGCVARFIHDNLPNVHMEVVEMDEEVVRVARDWFGFTEAERMTITCFDTVAYLKELASKGEKRHVVMLDVDNQVQDGGKGSPRPLYETEFFQLVNSILTPSGVFILNLVCQNETEKERVISNIKSIFGQTFTHSGASNVDEVIYMLPKAREVPISLGSATSTTPEDLLAAAKSLQEKITSKQKSKAKPRPVTQLSIVFDDLQIL